MVKLNGVKTAVWGVWALLPGIGEAATFVPNSEEGGNAAVVLFKGNGEDERNRKGTTDFAALEEAFFELLGRCDSPLLIERDAAEDELFEQFARFEAIWQDRRFLTNGEISPEARRRFELAEARFAQKAFEECLAAFEATFELEAEAAKTSEDKGNGEETVNEENKENEKDGENDGILRGRVRLRWGKTARIVYLTPDWSAFERRDGDGRRRRPSVRFSAPELAPEFDATELTLETLWELADSEDGENAGNRATEQDGEVAGNAGKTTVVGLFEALIGVERREWPLPLPSFAREDGGNGGKKGIEEIGGNKRSGEDDEDERGRGGKERANVFQSGEVRAFVGTPRLKSNGETTAIVRLEFAEAFDAFDSHRVWWDKNDFALCVDGDWSGNDGDAAKKRRWKPVRARTRERSARGVAFELDFPSEPALREAVARGAARLDCRVPRFFLRAAIPVSGVETPR
ncbi:MAG: hypothetical protein IKU86_03065 [Thermoguttaceae bacterium]|nr:hypothetical protein [Thermoguttaceae bacterium]